MPEELKRGGGKGEWLVGSDETSGILKQNWELIEGVHGLR